ncbi:MAG: ABC transporter permease [Oscillospiraceae bacterium]
MKAIFIRELKSYFRTPIGYVFIGFFMLLTAFFFMMMTLLNGVSDMSMYFSQITLVLVLLVPVLTMRTIAEERRNKTDQLLLTSSVSVSEIVLAKFFAVVALFALAMVATIIYPIILLIFGKPVVGMMIGQYLGFFLLGVSFIAVGIYISSLTENQIIAAIISFGVLLFLYLLNMIAPNISNPVLKYLASWLAITGKFQDFFRGMINPAIII